MQMSNNGEQLSQNHKKTTDAGYQYLTAKQAMERYGVDTGRFERRIKGALVVSDIRCINRIVEMANQRRRATAGG